MNTLLAYTKSHSYFSDESIELYSHFPSTFNYSKLFDSVKPNQNVLVSPTYNSIDCIIKQTNSTPGVVWEKIPIPLGSKYLTLEYDISSSIILHPYIRDLSGNIIYWLNVKTNLISLTSRSVCVKINSGITEINIYLLVPMGKSKFNSSFSITNISFDFTTAPNPTQLITSLYTHKKNLIGSYLLDPPIDQKFIPNSFAFGCQWTNPGFVTIPSQTKSGYYFLKLEYRSKIYWLSFIIKPRTNEGNKILLLANTNKWNAYNTWAGLDGSISLYTFAPSMYYQTNRNLSLEGTDGTKSGAPIVSNFVHTERPNTTASSYINTYFSSDIKSRVFFNDHIYGEMFLPNFLDGLGLGYEFDVITDQDMELLDLTKQSGYSIFMMHVHPEYWSVKQLDVLNQITKAGIGIMYLAGNGIYWKCTWVGNQMEVRKDRKLHLDRTKGGQYGELKFTDISNGQDIVKIYYSKMYSMDLNPPVPYKLTNPPGWLIQDIDLSGEYVGFKNLNSRSLDSGTSGWEVDNVQIPSNTKYIIGSSNDKLGQMIWKDLDESGGAVFSAGSIIYTGSLAIDPSIAKITTNVINKMLG